MRRFLRLGIVLLLGLKGRLGVPFPAVINGDGKLESRVLVLVYGDALTGKGSERAWGLFLMTYEFFVYLVPGFFVYILLNMFGFLLGIRMLSYFSNVLESCSVIGTCSRLSPCR